MTARRIGCDADTWQDGCEVCGVAHEGCCHPSWTGADFLDLSDPAKRWTCDGCGQERTREAE